MPCVQGCAKIRIEVVYQTGVGTAYGCHLLYNDEDDTYYTTSRTDVIAEEGSYYTETTAPGGIITNEEECGAIVTTTDKDPNTNYGAVLSSTTTLSGEVDPSAVASAARGAIEWGDEGEPEQFAVMSVDMWRGLSASVSVYQSTSEGIGVSCDARRAKFRLAAGYKHVSVKLFHDGGSVTIPADAWSGWLSVSTDGSITGAVLKAGQYASA